MRVCEVSPYGPGRVSGVSTVVLDLARGLSDRGHLAAVLAPGPGLATSSGRYVSWVKEISGPPRNLRFASRVLRTLWKHRREWDLVHVHQAHLATLTAALVARGLGKPVVATFHSAPMAGQGLRGGIDRLAQRILPSFCAECTFVSRYTREQSRMKGTVIHNGVDLNRILASRRDRQELRRSLKLDGFVVLFSGRRARSKGFLDLLAAVRRARDDGADVRLLIVGETAEEELPSIETCLRELKLTPFVTEVGPKEDSFRFLAAADVLALPSYHEGLPIVILEALAAGLPILASNVGGIPEIVEDQREGFLVLPGDIDSLASRLLRLAREPNLAAAMGQRAQERARAFELSDVIEAYLRVFEDALGLKGGSDS